MTWVPEPPDEELLEAPLEVLPLEVLLPEELPLDVLLPEELPLDVLLPEELPLDVLPLDVLLPEELVELPLDDELLVPAPLESFDDEEPPQPASSADITASPTRGALRAMVTSES